MEYTTLGRTGLDVSRLCLGAMTFGRESSEELSNQMLNRFVEVGGNFIDTADTYGAGVSEEIVGRWLKSKQRHDIVIATKVRFGTRKKTPFEETLSTLDRLVRDGKVRYIGASNYSGWQLQKSVDMSRQMGWEPFTCLQPLYNLLDRDVEWELIPVCLNEGLGVIPWSPLRGGWLSGKFHRGMTAPAEGSRVEVAETKGWSENWTTYNNEHTWSVIDWLMEIAKETNKTAAQVALNWVLQRPGVSSPIIGARNMEQLEDNLGAVGWSLSAEQMARLNKVSTKTLPYPYKSHSGL